MKLHPAATIDDLPIPTTIQPTRRWSGQMLELAAHVGPYAALLICDRLGGQTIRVPIDPAHNRMAEFLTADQTDIISRVYGGNQLAVPLAREPLREARRGPLIAAIRSGELTIQDAVPILRTTRARLSHLVNHSDEGANDRGEVPLPPRAPRDDRQIDMFDAA